jgi:hypothetical protein
MNTIWLYHNKLGSCSTRCLRCPTTYTAGNLNPPPASKPMQLHATYQVYKPKNDAAVAEAMHEFLQS